MSSISVFMVLFCGLAVVGMANGLKCIQVIPDNPDNEGEMDCSVDKEGRLTHCIAMGCDNSDVPTIKACSPMDACDKKEATDPFKDQCSKANGNYACLVCNNKDKCNDKQFKKGGGGSGAIGCAVTTVVMAIGLIGALFFGTVPI